jgi:hypothetical protein
MRAPSPSDQREAAATEAWAVARRKGSAVERRAALAAARIVSRRVIMRVLYAKIMVKKRATIA